MTALPSDEAIRARAEQLDLLAPGADLSPAVRRQVARILMDEANKPAPPPAGPILLSRVNHDTAGGVIRVDVLFIPTPQKEPSNGD